MFQKMMNLTDPRYSYAGGPDCFIEKTAYKNDSIILNKKNDRISGVPENIWNMYFGGYQPLQKWLKDRKGNTVTISDINHYQSIITTLVATNEIMQQIDEVIEF